VVALIHRPPTEEIPLENACAIAALIFMRSYLRDDVCNFRVVGTVRLQRVLIEMGDDLKLLLRDLKSRQRLIWVLTLGAANSAGEDRKWFVQVLRVICEVLSLSSWRDLRQVLVGVLWIDSLDNEGSVVSDELALSKQQEEETKHNWKEIRS
jgi:hypothetical protein